MSQKLMTQIVEAVKAVQRVPKELRRKTFFGKYELWMYNAVLDDRLCDICLEFEKNPRFLGSALRTIFPYLEILDEDTIKVHAHMPRDDHCRCTLNRVTEWTTDDIKWFVEYIPGESYE